MRVAGALSGSALVALLVLALFLGSGDIARAEPKPTPSPSPSPTPTPTPTPTSSPTPTPSPTVSPTPSVSPSPTEIVEEVLDEPREKQREPRVWWDFGPSFSGGYSTDRLVELEALLASFGVSENDLRDLYAPFIVRGPADFSDTWGSIRHADDEELRPHLGQDVFCDYDAEVLAVENGRVGFSTDELGGKVAHLYRPGGGYWYYAHLASYPDDLASGDRVETGDVIGYCGDSGNATGGSPHVHFGSYPGPVNPMGDLIGWLEEAEREAERIRTETIELRGEAAATARMFGDELITDVDPLIPERPDPVVPSVIDVILGYTGVTAFPLR